MKHKREEDEEKLYTTNKGFLEGPHEKAQTQRKALEKSIVARVVLEPGLGLIKPFEMD